MFKQFFEANKRYLKFFAAFYLIAFFAWNWQNISWAVNSRFLAKAAESFFAESGKALASEKKADDLRAGNNAGVAPAAGKKDILQKEDSLVIEKIGVEAPLVTSFSGRVKDIEASLEKGVAIYPSSSLPSEKGTTIILGHTAPDSWPRVHYYGIFNRLNELKKGDRLLVFFQGRQYVYTVVRQFLVNPGDQLNPSLTNYENVLFLSTCWPPNIGDHRIIIEAVR